MVDRTADSQRPGLILSESMALPADGLLAKPKLA